MGLFSSVKKVASSVTKTVAKPAATVAKAAVSPVSAAALTTKLVNKAVQATPLSKTPISTVTSTAASITKKAEDVQDSLIANKYVQMGAIGAASILGTPALGAAVGAGMTAYTLADKASEGKKITVNDVLGASAGIAGAAGVTVPKIPVPAGVTVPRIPAPVSVNPGSISQKEIEGSAYMGSGGAVNQTDKKSFSPFVGAVAALAAIVIISGGKKKKRGNR